MTFRPQCPIPIRDYPRITLAHGGGGRLTADLVTMFRSAFPDDSERNGDDAACFELSGPAAMTTDAFVVSPRFFPGGSLGKLAVYGVVNDLACVGARAAYLSVSFVLEEGLAMDELWAIVCDLAEAARECDVQIVTGDTKVVERGKGDGAFISVSALGEIVAQRVDAHVEEGARVLLSGDLARHGIAVMLAREDLGIHADVESDCGSIWPLIQALNDASVTWFRARDLTRGGLATCMNEVARELERRIVIDEDAIPVCEGVQGACELLGLDPLYVANEGTCAIIVAERDAARALAIARTFRDDAALIGRLEEGGGVVAENAFGTRRVLDLLSGAQLPRIC